MPSPIQTFKDNIRPANLMLQVYSLLDTNDHISSEAEMIKALRAIVQAEATEELLLVYNELFLGLVRERAQLPPSTLRRASLNHLLRQAVVAGCTALDTYLPSLLRVNLPTSIRAFGRDFIPRDDAIVMEFFQDLTFSLDETLRLLADPNAAEYIANKILGLTNFSYLSSRKGVHVTGRLLGVQNPWDQISNQLGRDKKEMGTALFEISERRNSIVHRADRSKEDPDGHPQEISYAWAKRSVDTVEHISLALDEIVQTKMIELQAVINAR